MISFNCPQCRTPYDVEDEMADCKGKCGVCNCKFIIPTESGVPVAVAAEDAPARPLESSAPKIPEVYVRRVVRPPPTEAELQAEAEARQLEEAAAAAVAARRRRRWLCMAGGLFAVVAGVGSCVSWMNRLAEPKEVSGPPFVLAPGVAADGILHQWNFDEVRDWHDSPYGPLKTAPTTVFDVAGGWGLTPVEIKANNWVSGHEFMGLSLPGKGAYLESGRNLAPELGGTASVAYWFCTIQDGAETCWEAPGIFGAVSENHKNGIHWGWLNKEGRLGLSADKALLACTPKAVTDGKWHFVVMTRDAATGTGQIYLDGALVDSRPGPKGKRKLHFKSLGRIEGPAGYAGCFAGRLDEVTVFNRVVSAGEVKSFMANHAPKAWDSQTEGSADRPVVTESILARAYDAENDRLAVRGWSLPAHGAVTYGGEGSFTYVPASGYVGDDSFGVTIQDGKGGFRHAAMKVSLVKEIPGGGVPVTRFAGLTGVKAGPAEISLTGWRVPRAVDWDEDGKIDLLVGATGNVWFYRNTGTPQAPALAAGVKLKIGKNEIKSGDGNCPIALADMNGDGHLDLVVADSARKLQVYIYTVQAGKPPSLAAPVAVKKADGKPLVLADRRFDLGDWNGDGKPDLVVGTTSSEMRLFLNAGTIAEPRYDASTVVMTGSYNLYPRLCDLNGNGQADLVRGINWGGASYWLDVGTRNLAKTGELVIVDAAGKPDDLKASTDGAIVDFADLNGDGVPDLVIGGHAGSKIQLAYGARKMANDYLAEIETIYNAHPDDLGPALSADKDALLGKVNEANRGMVSLIQNGSPAIRAELYAALVDHIKKYPFLKYQKLDTKKFHHVPSIVLQNWVFLTHLRPDTAAHRKEVADVLGLTGTVREIFLESSLALGDNGNLNEAQLGTVREMMRHQPRELFPDSFISFDQLFGDQRGGFVWTPDSAKNTFGCDVGLANEWDRDLTEAIESVSGKESAHGDYFTFVMGHEVTHSIDGYVSSRANQDLRRRWGQMLCLAAGPDIVAGANGWIDWEATKKLFQKNKLYAPPSQKWEQAWKDYWDKGPGAKFRHSSFMRGGIGIDWFLASPQESLATQANHHWASGPGRLIGAVARFQRGVATGNLPEKANINEVVTFIDFLSVGMNRVALPKTTTVTTPEKRVEWTMHLADLERDDNGRIIRIIVDGRIYDFSLDPNGIVVDVRCTPPLEFKAK